MFDAIRAPEVWAQKLTILPANIVTVGTLQVPVYEAVEVLPIDVCLRYKPQPNRRDHKHASKYPNEGVSIIYRHSYRIWISNQVSK